MNVEEEVRQMLSDYRYALEKGLVWQMDQSDVLAGVIVDLENLLNYVKEEHASRMERVNNKAGKS